MKKVITYGTFDLLHYGHINLLKRAKKLGDYLIVGVTADDFDKRRGKINVEQSSIERVEAVRALGIADEIIIEEYEGQKIDDIKKFDVDIFAIGSDWVGQFDYLQKYCQVVYLARTEGVSSSEIREDKRMLKMGVVGDSVSINKIVKECDYVNGIHVEAICTTSVEISEDNVDNIKFITSDYKKMLQEVDAVYIRSVPSEHYEQVRYALENNKHVICEAPLAVRKEQCEALFELADANGCVLMEGIKTAYSTAYWRLSLLANSGKIGKVTCIDATCTSLRIKDNGWSSLYEWGPTAMLPVFQLLGTDYISKSIVMRMDNDDITYDTFSKIDFTYDNAVASLKLGNEVKSESELVIAGTKGYIYVPAPWWKTDYFEIRYENASDNKRYFYQLDGEGIRYELVAFVKAIQGDKNTSKIDREITYITSQILQDAAEGNDVRIIN